MRILITSGSLYGHVNTLLPLALAALRAGHQVVFATGADLVPHVAAHGLLTWTAGLTHRDAGGNRQESWLDYFAATARHRLVDLMPRALAWRPHLVIHEETELAGPVLAASTGARHVVHGLGLMPSARIWSRFFAEIESMAASLHIGGLATTLHDATYLHVCPRALQPSDGVPFRNVVPLRPVSGLPVADQRLPAALEALPHEKAVHLTLGTVFHEARHVLAAALEGLKRLPVNVVVTAGPDADVSRFGWQPPHVVIERYLPHRLLLPRCDLVVGHGGAGILFGALSHGLPQLVLPQGADQFMNADACCASGAGLVLQADAVSADAVEACAKRLLGEPQFTAAARSIKAQIDAMPDADAVLAALAERKAA